MTGDVFWAQDISVLYDYSKLSYFFPSKTMTLNEKMNAIVRLSVYISMILFVYNKKPKYILIVLFSLILTYIIVEYQSEDSKKEEDLRVEALTNNIDLHNFKTYREARLKEMNKEEVGPTEGNPFGNVTFVDYIDNPDRGPAKDINDPNVKKEVDSYFNKHLYSNVTDIFAKMNSQRQFYTMPSTEIPNDRESYQNWLYGEGALNSGYGKTCKEDQNACYRYQDPRHQSQILMNEYKNPL